MADDKPVDTEVPDVTEKDLDDVHDTAHSLADALLAAFQVWVATQPRGTASSGAVLIGVEVLPAVARRIYRDHGFKNGLTKEQMKEVIEVARKQGSACARGYYEAMADLRDAVEAMADSTGFVIPTDPKFEH